MPCLGRSSAPFALLAGWPRLDSAGRLLLVSLHQLSPCLWAACLCQRQGLVAVLMGVDVEQQSVSMCQVRELRRCQSAAAVSTAALAQPGTIPASPAWADPTRPPPSMLMLPPPPGRPVLPSLSNPQGQAKQRASAPAESPGTRGPSLSECPPAPALATPLPASGPPVPAVARFPRLDRLMPALVASCLTPPPKGGGISRRKCRARSEERRRRRRRQPGKK